VDREVRTPRCRVPIRFVTSIKSHSRVNPLLTGEDVTINLIIDVEEEMQFDWSASRKRLRETGYTHPAVHVAASNVAATKV
jgi:hypothetical protein